MNCQQHAPRANSAALSLSLLVLLTRDGQGACHALASLLLRCTLVACSTLDASMIARMRDANLSQN